MDYPNVQKVIGDMVTKNIRPAAEQWIDLGVRDAWVEYLKSITKPGYDYFMKEVSNHDSKDIFVACQLANPSAFRREARTAIHVRTLLIPLTCILLSNDLINRMIEELSFYTLQAETCAWENERYDVIMERSLDFWKRQKLLPVWKQFAYLVCLIQPSSATVERAFSILKYLYTDQHSTSIQDTVEGKLMLRFNRST